MPVTPNPVAAALQALGVRVPPPSAGTLPAGNEEAGSILGVPERSVFDSPQRRLLRGLDYLLRMGKGAVLGGSEAPGRTPENAGETLTTGIAALGPALAKIVYHGSPHLFDKFDMSKVGTGEGGAAQGHGLYFADMNGVAKTYADPTWLYKGARAGDMALPGNVYHVLADLKKTNPAATIEDAAKAFDEMRDRINVVHKIASYGDKADQFFTKPQFDEFSRLLQSGELQRKAGNLYEVDLPDEAIANMLDWDAPLSQQTDAVRQAVEARGMWARTGQEVMEKLWKRMGPEAASEYLRSSGVPGVKYFDQASRGAGQGTRNYVVFDDQLPKIVKVRR